MSATNPDGRVVVSGSSREERARSVAENIHSGQMEGLDVSAATRADAGEYVEGLIDIDELVYRTRARYGLI